MIDDAELELQAGQAPFIFGGEILSEGSSAAVAVDEVIRVPEGLTGFAGSRVTVHLERPLKPGRYIFFADPFSVGGGLAVRERAHLEGASREVSERVIKAVHGSYSNAIAERMEAAALVVLGRLGDVRPLTEGRPRGVPWAVAPLEIERVLKGPGKTRHAVVVGPRYGSRHLPAAPPLRPGLHAIFFLTHAPHDVPKSAAEGHDAAYHIATSRDIQPPERLAEIEHIAGKGRK
jgi:hypothetical protein